ncbi:MAG: hypothetical protein R3F59_06860 [Myxococcota bacterium]
MIALIVGVWVASTAAPTTGVALSLLAVAAGVFYVTLQRALTAPERPVWLPWLAPAFEVLMPAASMWCSPAPRARPTRSAAGCRRCCSAASRSRRCSGSTRASRR